MRKRYKAVASCFVLSVCLIQSLQLMFHIIWRALIEMADKKVLFIAFAIEDERQRDFLKGQSLRPRQPFEFIDMSVKEPYDKDWKDRVRTRIKRSDGVIVLVSKNSAASTGQK